MSLDGLALPAFILLIVTSMVVLLSRDWRWSLVALSTQYLGVFYFVAQNWPFSMAVIKLVVGWMAGAALGTTLVGQRKLEGESLSFAGRVFPFLAGCLVIILVFSLAPQVLTWFPNHTSIYLVDGGMTLVMMGLLQMGMTGQPYRVILGLLTMFAGFEVLYASVEVSILVAGLLAAVNLGLALIGIYFITNSTTEGSL